MSELSAICAFGNAMQCHHRVNDIKLLQAQHSLQDIAAVGEGYKCKA